MTLQQHRVYSDEELRRMAVTKLCGALSPLQLYWLAVRIDELASRGYGEMRLTWHAGQPDTLSSGPTDKMTQLAWPDSE